MGDRDSEVAVVIQGKKFASSLRHQIWSVALGINEFGKRIFGYSPIFEECLTLDFLLYSIDWNSI